MDGESAENMVILKKLSVNCRESNILTLKYKYLSCQINQAIAKTRSVSFYLSHAIFEKLGVRGIIKILNLLD